jgi:predicted NAD-dependent protein-ADP-ribosyltransferase YbiA (DUF1768 family)
LITDFRQKYRIFSNFYMKSVSLKGLVFPTNENAYQAAKLMYPEDGDDLLANWTRAVKLHGFLEITPGKARDLGQIIRLRSDWTAQVRYDTMKELCRRKFREGYEREFILATGDQLLMEGTYWHDNFFGVCFGEAFRDPATISKHNDPARRAPDPATPLCAECLKSGINPDDGNRLGRILMEVRAELQAQE